VEHVDLNDIMNLKNNSADDNKNMIGSSS